MKRAELILVAVSVVAIALNLYDMPLGGILTVLALSSLAAFYMYASFAFLNGIELKTALKKDGFKGVSDMRVAFSVGAGFAFAGTVVGILFSLQHWPFAGVNLPAGLIGLLVIGLIAAFKYLKGKSVFYYGILIRIAMVGGIGLVFLLVPAITWIEIKYRNHPAYIEAYKKTMANPDDQELWKQLEQERKKMEGDALSRTNVQHTPTLNLREGDLIFQHSTSGQSKAIQLATGSEYTHCGIIIKEGDQYFVFEAVQPVKFTPLNEWIARGEDEHYVIKRLKNADSVLRVEVLGKMKEEGMTMSGKDYDLTFEWNDDRMYCSELIWKIYQRSTGLEIGKLQKLKDFDLSSDIVKKKLKERYGDNIPLEEPVISPVSVFESELLETVKEK